MLQNIRLIVALLMLFMGLSATAQKTPGPAFDIADFNKKMEVVEWLCEYDMIAWVTSDSVMAQNKEDLKRLGSDWFCFQRNNMWHAVYGKYENSQFDLVFHFTVDNKGRISKTSETVDTALLHRYSRALHTAGDQLKELKDTINLRFNQYIRENEDGSLSVWILPAFQPNSVAVYGGEFIYTIDPAGTKIVKDDSYFKGFRGFKVDSPKEILIDYSEIEKPTLGAMFFVWYYKNYFTQILLHSTMYVSTAIKSEDHWTWLHAEKDLEKEKKKK